MNHAYRWEWYTYTGFGISTFFSRFFFPFFTGGFLGGWVPLKFLCGTTVGRNLFAEPKKGRKRKRGKKKIPACGRKFLHRFNLPL